MISHVSCPKCHTKFFQISNMTTVTSKKDCSRVSPLIQKPKWTRNNEQSNAIENIRHENVQLVTQNGILKSEVQDLIIKNDHLAKALKMNKDHFGENLKRLQDAITQNEIHLVENSRKCLDEQKRYAEELRKLRKENENLKNSRVDANNQLVEKLKALESETKLLKLENENLKALTVETEQRCVKYRAKLKHAVKIVAELNEIVAQYGNKPEIICETTQTEGDYYLREKQSIGDCTLCKDAKYEKDRNSENMILSDIFFKPKSFLDSEINLFAMKSKQNIPSRAKI